MIYLGQLNKTSILRDISERYSPTLLYFICYRGNPERFRPPSQILDIEQDCKILKKFLVTDFKPRKERDGHFVTFDDCKFTNLGEEIFQELTNHKICSSMHRIFNQKDNLGNHVSVEKNEFIEQFHQNFSFDVNPQKKIEKELENIKNKYCIDLPPNGYQHNSNRENCTFVVNYEMKGKELIPRITLECVCHESFTKEITTFKNIFKFHLPIQLECPKCGKDYVISSDMYYCM